MKRFSVALWITAGLAILAFGFASFGFTSVGHAQISETASAVSWSLDLQVDKFGSVNVTTKSGKTKSIWYLAYTLENKSGLDAPLAPVHFRLDTDTDKTYRELVNKKAEELLEKKWDRKLVTCREREETLGDGETLHGLVIFGELDDETDKIAITVTGLEDVVYRVGPKRFFQKRGLVLEWERPGDEYFTQRDPLKFKKRSWKVLEGPREIR